MTLPPLEPRKNYVAHRVEELLNDDRFFIAVASQFEEDAFGPVEYAEYVVAEAYKQAEREWADRMEVLLDADINNLELHDER